MPMRQRLYIGRSVISSPSRKIPPPSGFSRPTIMWKEVVFPAPLGPRRPTTSPRWMSKLTVSTTRRGPKRLSNPWAIKPSMVGSRAREGARHLRSVALPAVRGLGVEDGFHALLVAALDDAPLLGQVDRDPVARHDVVLLPHPGGADEHHALLGVVVFGPLRGADAAVLRDDPDVAHRDRPDDAVALRVQVDLRPVGVLDRLVLARHHVAGEDDEAFLLHALHLVRVHGDRLVLPVFLRLGRGRVAPGRGLLGLCGLGQGVGGEQKSAPPNEGSRQRHSEDARPPHRDRSGGRSAKVARRRPFTCVRSSAIQASSPCPWMTAPSRKIVTGSLVQTRRSLACQRSVLVSSRSPSLPVSTTFLRISTSFVASWRSPSSPVTVQVRSGSSIVMVTFRRTVLPSREKTPAWRPPSRHWSLPLCCSWRRTSLMR